MSENSEPAEPVNKKAKTKKSIWNVFAAVFKREHGTSQQQSDSFDKDCYSSPYIVKRMRLSYHLEDLTYGDAPVINFNNSGDLICAGCTYNEGKKNNITLIDWAGKKIKENIEIVNENEAKICDLNFLNIENSMIQSNIVSIYENGILRHDNLRPTGDFRTTQTQQLSNERHKLAICPGKQYELLSAAVNGNIYGVDLRMSTPTLLAQTKPVGKFVKLHAISHHPLAPQICASYSDYNARIFDKRRFVRPLHEICPSRLKDTNSFANFSDCYYSYDGSEILAIYADEQIYLFDSENERPGEYKQSFDQSGLVGFNNKVSFFGPKSEYILVGNDGQYISFINKVTGKYENGIVLRRNARFYSVDFLTLKSHPHLPVVAASLQACGLSILSPSSKETESDEYGTDTNTESDNDN